MQVQTLQGFRLSPQQKHLWLLEQDSLAYRAQCAIQIEGNIDAKVLKQTLEQIVARHEILRTLFYRKPGIKIPIQVIADQGKISWNQVTIMGLNPRDKSDKIEQLLQEQRNVNFNFEQPSLLQSCLLTLAVDLHSLLITLPALYADSWTLKNLVKEIGKTYEACLKGESLPDEPVQYLQFSEWQNELLEDEEAEEGKAYWRNQTFPSIRLPFEAQSQIRTGFKPDVYRLKFNPNVAAKIKSIAGLYNASISEFLLACWLILIGKITGQSDIVTNTVYSGRNYEELHEVLGLLAKFLPVRCSLPNKLKFSELLSQLGETLREIDQWQDYFVGEESRDSDYDTVNFPISFEFEDWSDQYCSSDVLFSVDQQYVCFDRFKVKLTCMQKKESITAEFHYDTARFDKDVIQCFAEQFQTLVESVVNNPEAAVGELNSMSDRTRHYLLVELNNTETNYPQDQCIHHRFEEQVKRTPDKIAVVFENQQLTYAELNKRANQLAHYLQQQGVSPEVLVGIYVERSLDNIIALIAILKAGGAYLPIDPALPKESLAFRLEDAKVSILLTQKELLNRDDIEIKNLVYLDVDWETITQESNTNLTNNVTVKNLAYVLYTSGSTGQPKGVAIEHQQILNYLYAILDKLELPKGASFATVSTFAADLGNTAIFPALCTGGCLHIISQDRASDPEALAEYFQQHSIDCLKIVPSHLATLLTSSVSSSLLPRQCLVLGGEAVSWDLIEKVQKSAPNCRIVNHYGPTETTVGVLTYPIKSQQIYNSKTVPIGCAIANTQVYILDEQLQPVPIGVPGELYIGGAGLARGYLNQPELTAEKFISIEHLEGQDVHPTRVYKTGDKARYLPDGSIEFLQRVDYQVKIRGFRIELGEIEAVLSQHPGVRQVIVSLSEDESGNKRLVGYVVPNLKPAPSVNNLRQFLLKKFPEYMVPSAFVFLKSLPLTPNGKINRHALPAPEQTRPELEAIYIAPRTPVEKQLAEIWIKLLAIEKVGIHDNFFELGGHSLLITQLLAQLRDIFKVNLSLRSLFEQPTIANIANKIAIIQQAEPGTKVDQEESINLKDEAVLDPTICPDGIPYAPNITPVTIFLTGATGFLGSFLLYELLQQTQADIYCLVRAETIELGKKKIQGILESYLLWNDTFNSRIIPVIGDLSQPLLGLSQEQFQAIASQVDVIYHNGAFVNFTYPYSALKAANVSGTHEVLRLASQIKVKPVHFISTISVIIPNNPDITIVREQDNLDDAKLPSSGYTQSKWVAEKLVTIARERGLPVSIYRPGRISGHSQTGACNPSDHTYRMIKGCIQLRSIPNQDIELNLSPVDYVSKAIVSLSNQKESIGKAFHLINPQPLPLKEMVNYIRSLGYPIELLSYEQWRSQLINTADSSDNALYPLLSTFAEETSNTQSKNSPLQQFDCQNTLTGLSESSIICPPVDSQLLTIYFSYLIQTGFLNSPPLQLQTN